MCKNIITLPDGRIVSIQTGTIKDQIELLMLITSGWLKV